MAEQWSDFEVPGVLAEVNGKFVLIRVSSVGAADGCTFPVRRSWVVQATEFGWPWPAPFFGAYPSRAEALARADRLVEQYRTGLTPESEHFRAFGM